MNNKDKTLWEDMQSRGYSRRDFLKFCAWVGAFIGIESTGIGKVVHAMETQKRPAVIWMHFQECTCCSESFLRSSHPIVADMLLNTISLDYSETLMAASGHQAEAALQETIKANNGNYLLLIEGSVPTKENGVYCCIGGKTAGSILEEVAGGAKAIIAWGSCASNGCVQGAYPNPTGATPIHELIHGKPIIKVPGCPPIGEVMAGIIVHLMAFGSIPHLDGLGRPMAFYSRRVHDTCYRRPNYDAGLFVEQFDDENARKGYCLYKVGCRGPVTYNACGVTRWNDGTSFPIQSGHGCIGCSEANFWDHGPFYQHLASFPGFGIETNADTIGLGLGIATGAGILTHAVVTNVAKKKVIRKHIDESVREDEPIKEEGE